MSQVVTGSVGDGRFVGYLGVARPFGSGQNLMLMQSTRLGVLLLLTVMLSACTPEWRGTQLWLCEDHQTPPPAFSASQVCWDTGFRWP